VQTHAIPQGLPQGSDDRPRVQRHPVGPGRAGAVDRTSCLVSSPSGGGSWVSVRPSRISAVGELCEKPRWSWALNGSSDQPCGDLSGSSRSVTMPEAKTDDSGNSRPKRMPRLPPGNHRFPSPP
jgi:hypothetical protein